MSKSISKVIMRLCVRILVASWESVLPMVNTCIRLVGRYLFMYIYLVGTVPTRVADPVHFRPDPDPANQNFKTGSRIRFLL